MQHHSGILLHKIIFLHEKKTDLISFYRNTLESIGQSCYKLIKCANLESGKKCEEYIQTPIKRITQIWWNVFTDVFGWSVPSDEQF